MVSKNTSEDDDEDFEQTVNYTPDDFAGAYLVRDEEKYWLMKEKGNVGDAKFYACKTCGANTLVVADYPVENYQHEDDCHNN